MKRFCGLSRATSQHDKPRHDVPFVHMLCSCEKCYQYIDHKRPVFFRSSLTNSADDIRTFDLFVRIFQKNIRKNSDFLFEYSNNLKTLKIRLFKYSNYSKKWIIRLFEHSNIRWKLFEYQCILHSHLKTYILHTVLLCSTFTCLMCYDSCYTILLLPFRDNCVIIIRLSFRNGGYPTTCEIHLFLIS